MGLIGENLQRFKETHGSWNKKNSPAKEEAGFIIKGKPGASGVSPKEKAKILIEFKSDIV